MGGISTSSAVNTRQTVCQRHPPCHRPGCHHQPCAPNPSCEEALPSHPHPMLGGTSKPTFAPPTLSAQAMYLPRLESSLISLFTMTLSSPSNLPFKMISSFSTNSGGRFLDSFRDGDPPVPPRKCSRQKHCPCCVGQCHGPQAPDSQEHLLSGRQHWPRAPNQSTCHGWD
jgi:hypothetical protein